MRLTDAGLRTSASDLADFLACRHLTRLNLLDVRGRIKGPKNFDVGFQALLERGEAHEAAVLARFRDRGLEVLEVDGELTAAEAAAATRDAILDSVDAVFQGVLIDDRQIGRPDFIVRTDLLPAPDSEPRPPGVHYEVVDAKLARSAKARALLQTSFYTRLLTLVQDVEPRWMHLALGNGELSSFRVKDFASYERRTFALLQEFISVDEDRVPPSDTYPDPVEHCTICRWTSECQARRRADDDLSLIAGITKRQRLALRDAGYSTRQAFAALEAPPRLDRLGIDSLERAHLQARLQVSSDEEGAISYQLLEPERDDTGALVSNRGLLALPQPTKGDLFLDLEGARHYSEDGKEFGLQYLFGVVDTSDVDDSARPLYRSFWAFDRRKEKAAFEELIDYIMECRGRNPSLHVYHYNHYEPTTVDHLSELHETRQEAVGRLMGRFATREDEVDDLFRLGVFVDLYRVIRQGLRAGVESYSIKRLEPLCGYDRRVRLADATQNLIAFDAALDEGTAELAVAIQAVVAGYNEDDCRATLALRDWLEERRTELASMIGEELPRPIVVEEAHATADPEVERIKVSLLAGVKEEPGSRSPEDAANVLLADLLEWHRREAKPAWWRYFYVRTLSSEDLVREPDAIGLLEGGNQIHELKRSVVLRFTFPPQEHRFEVGDHAVDPVTRRRWTIWGIDETAGTIDLKIGAKSAEPGPSALVEGEPFDTRSLADRLRELGARIADGGLRQGKSAAAALLLRERPNGDGLKVGPLRHPDEGATAAAVRLSLGLSHSYLPIQGPPGAGKTYTAAELILVLVAANHKVGITGPSHAVIHNLLAELVSRAAANGRVIRIGQRADDDNPFLHMDAQGMSNEEIEEALDADNIDVAAGTVWLWARPRLQGALHTLVVDEAGQMSLANVLSAAGAADSVVLLGDPQQLAQPSEAAHPPGAGVSPLEHILGDHVTMRADAGLFMEQTRRMHPSLCEYTSEVFYDGKLAAIEGLDRQVVLGDDWLSGAGIRVIDVTHEGNTNGSPEEAAEVSRLVRDLLRREWSDRLSTVRRIAERDILVVTPYNVHRLAIDRALRENGRDAIAVGTVNKVQGRQAPTVIYSMATSSVEEAPRGMEFLYDGHRLNVATSRAQALAIIVMSESLIRVFCRTPRQMVLANALCRAAEMART